MRIKRHDIGSGRWHLTIWTDGWLDRIRFETWMKENLPDCMCIYRFNDGNEPHLEVRGSDQGDCMLLMLRWSL